jgi:hypothetical protein
VPVLVATAVVQVIAAGGLIGQLAIDLLLKMIAAVSPLSQFFVFFKRKKPFGRVIDSKHRRPVVGARVMLLNPETKVVIDTQTSDADGRYVFAVDSQTSYLLRIEANQYDLFEHLYRGTSVNRETSLGLALEYDAPQLRRRQRIDRTVVVMNAWRLPLLVVGTLMWLMLYIRDGGFTVWLGAYYALAWLLEVIIHTQPSPFGVVTDQATNRPLGGSVVRIFNAEGRLVLTFVTSANGRFRTLLRSGVYQIRVSHVGYQAVALQRVKFTKQGTLKAIKVSLKPQL